MLNWKKVIKSNEFIVAVMIVFLSIVIGLKNPAFFSIGNVFGVLRSSVVMGIFAMGVLIVLISGGVDVSFPAIALVSMYITVKILISVNYQGTVLVPFAMAGLLGLFLGLINAVFISLFKLPTMIVTLGTSSMFYGFMLFFIGSDYIRDIPQGMVDFAKSNLVTAVQPNGSITGLHPAILIFLVVAILTWLFLKYTMIGRGVYALGGDREAAKRAGFNVVLIEFVIYGFVGMLAGIGGITFGCLLRQANPFAIVGGELEVIAAVVLGGAAITGGRGTVIGAVLGVMLITIMNNSLILVGIPSSWQKVVVGFILIIGTALPALQAQRSEKSTNVTLSE